MSLSAPKAAAPTTSHPSVPAFRGDNSTECETFIEAMRNFAYRQSRQNDDKWMAEYAATKMSGKALRWHIRLDSATRTSWKVLEVALIDEWPSDSEQEDDDEPKDDAGDEDEDEDGGEAEAPVAQYSSDGLLVTPVDTLLATKQANSPTKPAAVSLIRSTLDTSVPDLLLPDLIVISIRPALRKTRRILSKANAEDISSFWSMLTTPRIISQGN